MPFCSKVGQFRIRGEMDAAWGVKLMLTLSCVGCKFYRKPYIPGVIYSVHGYCSLVAVTRCG